MFDLNSTYTDKCTVVVRCMCFLLVLEYNIHMFAVYRHRIRNEHLYLQSKDIGTLKALIAFGASVNYVNGFGCTPLDLAMMLSHTEAVKILREVGGKRRVELGRSGTDVPVREEQAQGANHTMGAGTCMKY